MEYLCDAGVVFLCIVNGVYLLKKKQFLMHLRQVDEYKEAFEPV